MTRNKYIVTVILASLYLNGVLLHAQTQVPRLVVSINVDQLRSDYMDVFSPLYGNDGFNKLLREGKVFEQAIHDFTPVDRASATATISTGALPFYNGIISASWLDRSTLRPVFCTNGSKSNGKTSNASSSAEKLLTSTVGDELKISTQGAAKVIGIAADKDAAILAVGHAADCAVWIDEETGKWTTADCFSTTSNEWVSIFEQHSPLSKSCPNGKWDSAYKSNAGFINPFVTNLALRSITNNELGKDSITDILSVTYSVATRKDKTFAEIQSEIQETYSYLDAQIAHLVTNVEQMVGADNVLFVLTSTGYDNSGNEDYAKIGIPSGTFYINRTANLLNMYLSAIYGKEQFVDGTYHNHIYLNKQLIEHKNISISSIYDHAKEFLMHSDGVRDIYTEETFITSSNVGINKLRNAYNVTLSGDIIIDVAPGWKLVNEDTGESYTPSNSAVIFPIIFYGSGINKDKVSTLVTTDCIAPTICKAIKIRAPNGCRNLPLF